VSEFDQPVQQKSSGTFASVLASITGKRTTDSWDDSGLGDDVATISYEQALRSHRRVGSSESATKALPIENADANSYPAASTLAKLCDKKGRKSASITLRLTAAEQAQLQERAAAARLSVSAYIRSCIFEAESLRAQVKEALAQMQTASPQTNTIAATGKPSRNWHKRLFPSWSRSWAAKDEEPTAEG
jgi:hypothetical protein